MAKFNQRKTIILIGLVVAGVIIGSWILFTNQISQFLPRQEKEELQGEISQSVTLIIDYGEGPVKSLEAEFREGMTVFDLLKNKTEEVNVVLKTKTYDMGIFVEAIENKENGSEGKYWLYYVNGEMPMVSTDKYLLKAGDKVEFKFEKSTF